MSEILFTTKAEGEMIEAGKLFSETLTKGAVVGLCGDLGAGKTHFSKGIVEGLGVPDSVTSPTFSLVNEYRSGEMPVFHIDMYRLEAAEELIQLGWDDYLDEEGIILVEWADRFPELLPDSTDWLHISITETGDHLVTRK